MASLKQRGKVFYAQYYVGKSQKRISLQTTSLQIAKEKLRQIESSLYRDDGLGLPTRTHLDKILNAYVNHIRAVKTPKSAQTDVYYLREAFGPVCPALEVTSRNVSRKARKRRINPKFRRRRKIGRAHV